MRSAFLCRASSITCSVKSLVRKSVFIVCGGLGSTSNPTLSQLSAEDRDAKSFKEEMRVFRPITEQEELQFRDWINQTVMGTRRKQDDNIQQFLGKTQFESRYISIAFNLSFYIGFYFLNVVFQVVVYLDCRTICKMNF